MTKTYSGGCACGSIRYSLTAEPVLVAHCHCRDCQRSSGAAMATVMAVPKNEFKILSGTTSSYQYTGDSGNSVIRHFCPKCGNPLFSDAALMQDLWFARVASLDNPSLMTPSMHIYCDSSIDWDNATDSLPRFAKLPS